MPDGRHFDLAVPFTVPSPHAVDLRAVGGGDEGVHVVVVDILHQCRKLILGEQRLYLHLVVLMVAALNRIEGAAAGIVGPSPAR